MHSKPNKVKLASGSGWSPPTKTADYVDSVCVTIYGFNTVKTPSDPSCKLFAVTNLASETRIRICEIALRGRTDRDKIVISESADSQAYQANQCSKAGKKVVY